MNITNAEYIIIERHPYLRFDIDGKEALIGEIKRSILDMGYVPLTSRNFDIKWGAILPAIHIPATESTSELNLKGFTGDPVIVEMAKTFFKAINRIDGNKFEQGPVSIPKTS